MKTIYLTLQCLLFVSIGFAQSTKAASAKLYNSTGYLYILKFPNGEIIMTENIISSPNDSVISMLSRLDLLKTYRVISKAGGWVMKMTPDVKVFISQILSTFNIEENDRDLPVYINDDYVDRPETIVADPKEITAVDVIKNPYGEGRIIDIITKDYTMQKKIDEGEISYRNYPYHLFYLQGGEIKAIDELLNNK